MSRLALKGGLTMQSGRTWLMSGCAYSRYLYAKRWRNEPVRSKSGKIYRPTPIWQVLMRARWLEA